MGRRRIGLGGATVALLAGLAFAAPAGATTFCVPGFHPACPMNGTNVAQPNLETAMNTLASDGNPDLILIQAGTFTDTDNLPTTAGFLTQPGTDTMEIVGAGPGQTLLTSTSTINTAVMALNGRAVTVRDLTIVIPDSLNGGAGLNASNGDTVVNVDVESRNADTNVAVSLGGNSSFRDGAVFNGPGGTLSAGINVDSITTGPVEIERTTITGPEFSGVYAEGADMLVTVRRSRIDAGGVGAWVANAGSLAVYNSLIQTHDDLALVAEVFSMSGDANLEARGVTMVNAGVPSDHAVAAFVQSGMSNSANLTVYDSIVRGYAETYLTDDQDEGTGGEANITLRYSNFPNSGDQNGDGEIITGPGNINADPLFFGPSDFHLLPGSPSIDAADPAPSLALADDLDGVLRPIDGNGDGVARRDMGAFEAPKPAPATPLTPTNPSPKCKRGQKLKKGKCVKKKRKPRKKR